MAWGMTSAGSDDGVPPAEVLSVETVDLMLKREGAVAYGNALSFDIEGEDSTTVLLNFQLRGWSAYSPSGVLPEVAPMWIFAGGNVTGGCSIAVRKPTGSCFVLLCSRNIGLAGALDSDQTINNVFSALE